MFAPTLTGLGDRSQLLKRGINLDTHIRDIVDFLHFEDLQEVILVGHSYSGMVIAGTAEIIPERLNHLVYLDALTPNDGQSFFDCFPRKFEKDVRRRADRYGEGWYFPYVRDWGTFGVTNKKDARWLIERLTAQPMATFEQKVRFRNPSGLAIPKTFIWCNDSKEGTKRNVRDDWSSLPATFPEGWGFYELKTGHDAMLTAPRELAKVLNDIATRR